MNYLLFHFLQLCTHPYFCKTNFGHVFEPVENIHKLFRIEFIRGFCKILCNI